LLPDIALRIDISDAGGALARAVEIDARDLAERARLEVRPAHEHGKQRRLRTGLRVVAAAEPLAKAAIGAGPERDAKRVRISLREIARGLREGRIAQLARGGGEEGRGIGLPLRRRRIVAGARAFEGISARLLFAADIAGLAGGAAEIFELVVIGLHLLIGDAPILDRHILGEEFLAVAL